MQSTDKLFDMKSTYNIIGVVTVVLLMAACGQSELEKKKAELEKLKTEQVETAGEITKLEKEISKLEPISK